METRSDPADQGPLTAVGTVLDPVRAPGAGEILTGRARALPLRREGPAKLTGAAKYTDDLVFRGAWYGATIRSTEPHARLLGFDRDPDFDWSSVVFLTAADIPGDNIVSALHDDQPALVEEEIQHHAEPLALLAAPDRQTLREARRHIRPRTETLPPVFDALASTHVFAKYEIGNGDVEAALRSADFVIEGEYRVGHQEQLYIENNAMIAAPRTDGGVTITGSMQCPYYVHTALKRVLALSDNQAVVAQAETGGGFGGKEEYPSMIAVHAALLAQRLGKPVRMIYDRHEDLAATTKRHPAIVRHRTGVSADGRLVAQDIDVVMDGGAYATLSPVVLSRGTLHAGGPYRCADVRIRGRVVATNTPPNGAFRGFGAPQTEFAAEMQANRAAERLGISPAELRRRWAYVEGDVTPTGQVLRESVAAHEVLERAAEASEFERVRLQTRVSREQRANTPDGRASTAHGVGLALAWHGAGFTGNGEVRIGSVAGVELGADATVRVLIASTEIGQGTNTIFPQLAAETLGIPMDSVEMAPTDTSVVPDSGPTVASRTAMVVGGLVVRACEDLKQRGGQRSGRRFAQASAEAAGHTAPPRIDRQFEPYPGQEFDDETYRGDAYPCFGW